PRRAHNRELSPRSSLAAPVPPLSASGCRIPPGTAVKDHPMPVSSHPENSPPRRSRSPAVHLDHQTPEPMPETGPPIEPGAASGGTTLGEERAAPDGAETAPSSDQLRQELLAVQERLDALIRSGEPVHA